MLRRLPRNCCSCRSGSRSACSPGTCSTSTAGATPSPTTCARPPPPTCRRSPNDDPAAVCANISPLAPHPAAVQRQVVRGQRQVRDRAAAEGAARGAEGPADHGRLGRRQPRRGEVHAASSASAATCSWSSCATSGSSTPSPPADRRPGPDGPVRRHQPGPALGGGRPQLRPARQPLLPGAVRGRLHAAAPRARGGRHAAGATASASPTSRPARPAPRRELSRRRAARAARRSSKRLVADLQPKLVAMVGVTAYRVAFDQPQGHARPPGARRSAAAPSGSSRTRAASTRTTSRPTSRACSPRRTRTRHASRQAP